jgi:hypothetical protein
MDFWFIFGLKLLFIASIVSLDISVTMASSTAAKLVVLLVFANENYEITAGMILLRYPRNLTQSYFLRQCENLGNE